MRNNAQVIKMSVKNCEKKGKAQKKIRSLVSLAKR